MTIEEAIKKRRSIRSYYKKDIPEAIVAKLEEKIYGINQKANLNFQLITKEEDAFGGFVAKYGKFSGVRNYIALVGEKSPDLMEMVGYYGEYLALVAQILGLNTCWVGLTVKKGVIKEICKLKANEKLIAVLVIGYGNEEVRPRTSKTINQVCKDVTKKPQWFIDGVEAALLAPTAMNQQRFVFTLEGNGVELKPTLGFYTKVDLGIVRYHFEVGAKMQNFTWLQPE